MRVISPSFQILDDYFQKGQVLQQIERCGRVCYKSEDKISDESAVPFIRGIIKRGHESVIEMANFCLEVTGEPEAFCDFFKKIPRFSNASFISDNKMIFSGNPRSFRDLARNYPSDSVVLACVKVLADKYPILFEDLEVSKDSSNKVVAKLLSAQEVDALPEDILPLHRCVLVHITVNRAVTHELVRHRVASYLQESQRYCRYGEDKFGGEVTFIKPCFYQEGTSEFDLWKKAMEQAEKAYLELLKTSSPQAARTVLPNSCKTEIMVHATLQEWQHIFRLRASKAADPSMREIMLMMLPEFHSRFPGIFSSIVAQVGQE